MRSISDSKEQNSLDVARNEALQNIGRNVVAFQKMEAMLKFLIANQKIEGLPDQLQEILAARVTEVERQTMGTLVNRLFQTVLADKPSSGAEEGSPDGAWSLSFNVELEDEGRGEVEKSLKLLVEERNALIHQMLANFNAKSIESCVSLVAILKLQRDKIKPHYAHLQSIVKTVVEGRKELFEFIASDEFGNAITNSRDDRD